LAFGETTRSRSVQLKQFLFRNLYRHSQVMQTTDLAKQVVRDLFDAYTNAPDELPESFGVRTLAVPDGQPQDTPPVVRVVADYIAGMTDRFASREHQHLTGQRLLV